MATRVGGETPNLNANATPKRRLPALRSRLGVAAALSAVIPAPTNTVVPSLLTWVNTQRAHAFYVAGLRMVVPGAPSIPHAFWVSTWSQL